MLHLITDPVSSARSLLALFSVDALRIIEGVYVNQFMKCSNSADVDSAFLLKTGRKINQSEREFQDRLNLGEGSFAGIYENNWHMYTVQAIFHKCGILPPSTEEIRTIYKDVMGYYPSYDNTHIINRLVRYRKYDMLTGYYVPNIWQVMQVTAAMDSAGLARKSQTISVLFNKIYKRDPKPYEVDICKRLDLTKSTEEIRHEVTSVISVEGEDSYRRAWRYR